MSHSKLALAVSLLSVLNSAAALAQPDPAAVVTAASVQAVLGGTFTAEAPEPGMLNYSEVEGARRVVSVYVSEGDARKLSGIRDQAVQEGETVDAIAALGDDAMYRARHNEATGVIHDASGASYLVSVAVQGAESAEATKKLATELVIRAVKK
jgi:hypothetical protein